MIYDTMIYENKMMKLFGVDGVHWGKPKYPRDIFPFDLLT